ncbi:hypothetical protein Btru_011678 [Bulinus truncatus]|nr:hypothetical protein Btru_011678 [Bulinus truncatus]
MASVRHSENKQKNTNRTVPNTLRHSADDMHQHNDKNFEDCTCEPCKRFWNRSFVEKKNGSIKSISDDELSQVQKGDRVVVYGASYHNKGGKILPGVVQYIGLYDKYAKAPRLKVGVSLYDNAYTTHNGIYRGKRYFYCPQGHGAMVNITDLQQVKPISRTPPLTGNFMFPSYEEMVKRRKLRQKKIQEEEEKLKKDQKLKQMEERKRYSRSAPQQLGCHNKKCHSEDDENNHISNEDQNETDLASQKLQVKQMKKIFGEGDKAERMALTLLKLYQAYEQGKQFVHTEQSTH